MTEITWVKLSVNLFDNRKIKHLRRLPEGDSIVLLWIALLTISGRCNNAGRIFLTENIPYTPKMLADELGFEENTVRLALSTFEQLDMIQQDNGYIVIIGWEDHQNYDAMEKIKEQNRERKQKQREKQKLLLASSGSDDMSRDSHVTVTGEVTPCHATDIESKNIEKENIYMADKPPKQKKFIKPTVEEVAEYCRERQNRVNAQKFVDFYDSKGWVVGKSPMKDWKAAVRHWEQSQGGKPQTVEDDPLPKDVFYYR